MANCALGATARAYKGQQRLHATMCFDAECPECLESTKGVRLAVNDILDLERQLGGLPCSGHEDFKAGKWTFHREGECPP